MTGPCTHGMPTPGSSVDCMDEGNLPPPPPRPEPERAEVRVRCAFDGQCPACNRPFRLGEWIVRTTRGRWIHETCLPTPNQGAARG